MNVHARLRAHHFGTGDMNYTVNYYLIDSFSNAD